MWILWNRENKTSWAHLIWALTVSVCDPDSNCSALSFPPSPSTIQSYRLDDEPDRLSNRLLEYDPNTNKWTELCPMKYSKYRCSAVVLNSEIFVMGKIIFSVNLLMQWQVSMHINPLCNMLMTFSCRRYWMWGCGSWAITPLPRCSGNLQPGWRLLEGWTLSSMCTTLTAHQFSKRRSRGRQDLCVWILQRSR